jgi:hypothetical protein
LILSTIDSENDEENDTKMRRSRKIPPHKPIPLNKWKENCKSMLNSYQRSEWLHRRESATTSSIQSNNIYVIEWDAINIAHNGICDCDTNAFGVNLTLETLFDEINGVSSLWVPITHLPNNNNEYNTITCAITTNNNLYGLLVIEIGAYEPASQQGWIDRNNNHRKCVIHQRAPARNPISFDNCHLNGIDKCRFFPKDLNHNNIIINGRNDVDYNSEIEHMIVWYSFDLNPKMGYDNSFKLTINGHAGHTAHEPCYDCHSTLQDIRSFPTPDIISSDIRTLHDTICDAQRAVEQDEPDSVDLTLTHGIKHLPIFRIRPYQHGSASMHDFEGIYAAGMDTFADMLRRRDTSDPNAMQNLQEYQSTVQELYRNVTQLEDCLNELQHEGCDEFTDEYRTECELKLQSLRADYISAENEYQSMVQDSKLDNLYTNFVIVLNEHKVNLNYCLSGSIQGVMCKRIDNARDDLVKIASDYNIYVGNFWKLYFCDLCYIHDMLKCKNTRKWNHHEISSVWHAYIDWLHKWCIAVFTWRCKGLVTAKAHYIGHEIARAISMSMSCAYTDDQRTENFNQHFTLFNDIFLKYTRNDRELRQAKRMNNRVLSNI